MSEQGNILILGLGSEILRDDGIGPRLVRDLRAHFTSSHFRFKTSTVGGLDIIDLIRGYHTVFIIDGVKSKQVKPAEVHMMDQDRFIETLHLSNIHDASFQTALKFGKEIGTEMPGKVFVIGVGVEEDTEFGETLTDRLQEEYVNILNKIHHFILERFRAYKLSMPASPFKER